MWPLFKNKTPPTQTTLDEPKRKPLSFEMLLEGMGNLSELDSNDTALKFWLPEPAERALNELSRLQGVSMSSMLREFFAAHCYGIYVVQLLRTKNPEFFRDPDIRFSLARGTSEERKVRNVTYWVPELGKNVAPVKLWVSKQLRGDLQSLADHTKITLSQYLREIAISRLLGHGMLPKRPEMLFASPLSYADDWCEDREVPFIQVDEATFHRFPDGRKETEWEDE
jgi:hypothetical protein